MLRNNGTYFDRIKPLGGSIHALGFNRVSDRQKLIENFSGFGQQVSMPQGYQSAYRAIIPTLEESGNMFVSFLGVGTLSASASTAEQAAVAFSGEGAFSPNAQHAYTMTVAFQGEGTLSLTAQQLEQASVAFDSGSRPSAFDIAQEVWQAQASAYNSAGSMGEKVNDAGSASNPWAEVIESGYTAGEILKILAAVAAGKTNITDLGGGSATVEFTGLDGTTVRVDADMTGSERTSIAIDAT